MPARPQATDRTPIFYDVKNSPSRNFGYSIAGDKKSEKVSNTHTLKRKGVVGVAPSMIQLLLNLKDNIRVPGIENMDNFDLSKAHK